MTAQSFQLQFDGYWREPNKASIPAASGIYCVYTSTYNTQSNTVTLNKLVYIGESKNVRDRIATHEKWPNWRRHLRRGEQITFNYAPIITERERAEAAMINKHKPPENTEYVNDFPYDRTTIKTSGKNALLYKLFTVERTYRTASTFY